MTEDNVSIVRRNFEAYARGDIVAMLADTAEDVITTRAEPDAGKWRGRDGFLEAFVEWVEGFDEFSLELTNLVETSDSTVLARTHQHAVGSESGVPIEGDFWMLFTFSKGQIERVDIYASEQQALEATRPDEKS